MPVGDSFLIFVESDTLQDSASFAMEKVEASLRHRSQYIEPAKLCALFFFSVSIATAKDREDLVLLRGLSQLEQLKEMKALLEQVPFSEQESRPSVSHC